MQLLAIRRMAWLLPLVIFMIGATSVEEAFMTRDEDGDRDRDDTSSRPHLTRRDQHANTLEDMFDFDRSPSLHTSIGQAAPPVQDCTPQ